MDVDVDIEVRERRGSSIAEEAFVVVDEGTGCD